MKKNWWDVTHVLLVFFKALFISEFVFSKFYFFGPQSSSRLVYILKKTLHLNPPPIL